ncbi:hypothetical protein Tco_0717537 [Tanacetum coccineum]
MADSQSPEKEVKGINSRDRVTGPRKGSAVPFSTDPHHPPSTFISKEKNILKTRRAKPNEKLGFQGKPHPSPVPKHTSTSVVPHEGYDRTNDSNGQRNDVSRKKKCKKKDAEKLDPTRSVRRRTTVGMIREYRMIKEAQGPVPERRITHPWIQASEPEETNIKEEEEIQEQNNEKEKTAKSGQSSSSRPDREAIQDKKRQGKG